MIAADIPSGVDATTGEVAPAWPSHCVATAAFHRPKLGVDPPRQRLRRGRRGRGDRHPGAVGRPGPTPGLIRRGRSCATCRKRRVGLDEVLQRQRLHHRRLHAGLTGAPVDERAGRDAEAGYVTVGAPASLELSFTVRLLEAMMVEAARGRLRPPRSLERGAAAEGDQPRERGRARPGALEGPRRAGRRWSAPWCRRDRRAARDRRGRAQRPGRPSRGDPTQRPLADRGADAARRRARARCWTPPPRRSSARGCGTRARRRRSRRRSSCSRATTRSSPPRTAAWRSRAGALPGLATAGTG